ncbi:AAA family ATPase [Sorangium sp. So ce176]|uniref:ATP-binding protein n=1 Tax=Sorangium sp. So ce176 TaxID=3133286 RepID=UPI003F607703
MSSDRITALERALDVAPDNHPLRLLLAEMLQGAGRPADAARQYEALLDAGELPREALLDAARLSIEAGSLQAAARCLDAARKAGLVEGIAETQARLDAKLDQKGVLRLVHSSSGRAAAAAGAEGRQQDRRKLGEEARATFAEIGGLEEVKKAVHRAIILPLQRPELYAKYGRKSGGGILLYGPPGCGKTLLARATAGECNLPFFNVRIEDILDPYVGVSERNLHDAFEEARAHAPGVLFLDELDALAFARRKHHGGAGRPLVDQLLQELDSIGSENKGLLVLGATNAPWDVDDALKRPGRFDRLVFVPPPDEEARRSVLEIALAGRPAERLDLKKLARLTPLFSGADLRALVEQAFDRVIEEALDTGTEPPLTMKHVEAALEAQRPTTLEWLARARNYVEFANQSEQYKDVALFLKSREARAWKD